jgi:hypothetical protein
MTARGQHEADRYVPEPSVARFEAMLGAIVAERPCFGCGTRRGPGPLTALDGRWYHPECGRQVWNATRG